MEGANCSIVHKVCHTENQKMKPWRGGHQQREKLCTRTRWRALLNEVYFSCTLCAAEHGEPSTKAKHVQLRRSTTFHTDKEPGNRKHKSFQKKTSWSHDLQGHAEKVRGKILRFG